MPLKKRSLRSMLQDANRASLDVPAPVTAPEADLHSPDAASGEVVQYHAKGDAGILDPIRDGETQVFHDADLAKAAKPVRRRLTDAEARNQAERAERGLRGQAEAARPAKPLAQELAELKPELPMGPLEGQGAMEGKPVESVVDRRGANIGRMGGERRAASGNMVTATPSNADIGEAAIKEDALLAGRTTKPFDVGRSDARNTRMSYDDAHARPGYPWSKPEPLGEMARSSARNQEAAMLGEMKPSEPAPFDVGREAAQYTRDTYKPRPGSATSVTTPAPVENVVGTAGKPGRWATIVGDAAGAAGKAAGEVYGAYKAGAYGTAGLRTLRAGWDVATSPIKYITEPMGKAVEGIAARNQRTRLLLEGMSEKSLARRVASGMVPRAGRAIGNTAEVAGAGIASGARALGMAADIATMEWVGRTAQASTEARQAVNSTQKAQLESYKQQGQNYGFDVTGREGGDAYMQAKAFVGADPKIEVRPNASLREQYEARNKKRIRVLIASGAVTPVATGRPTISGSTDE